jgi:hypothetical protein
MSRIEKIDYFLSSTNADIGDSNLDVEPISSINLNQ